MAHVISSHQVPCNIRPVTFVPSCLTQKMNKHLKRKTKQISTAKQSWIFKRNSTSALLTCMIRVSKPTVFLFFPQSTENHVRVLVLMWCAKIKPNTGVLHNTEQSSMAQAYTAQADMTQNDTTECITKQHNAAQHDTTQNSRITQNHSSTSATA